MLHCVAGSMHTGSASEPTHCATQRPIIGSGPTPQQKAPRSQSSIQPSDASKIVHGSPAPTGDGWIGTQPLPSHACSPKVHGMHFSPTGQSCAQTSHSSDDAPKSNAQRKPSQLGQCGTSCLPTS